MAEPRDKAILTVEDDDETLEFIHSALRKENFRVVMTKDGQEALKFIKTSTFDLIILDMMLPGKSGFEIIKSLQTDEFRHIPIFVITGKFEKDPLMDMLKFDSNVKEYLYKPINTNILVTKIHSILGTGLRTEKKEISEKKVTSIEIEMDSPKPFESVNQEKTRKYSRVPLNISVDTFSADRQTDKGKGYIINFSLGGIALETMTKLDINTEIYMRVNLPGLTLDFFGKTAHEQQLGNNLYKYGVKYTRLNIFDKFKLKKRILSWLELQEHSKETKTRT